MEVGDKALGQEESNIRSLLIRSSASWLSSLEAFLREMARDERDIVDGY